MFVRTPPATTSSSRPTTPRCSPSGSRPPRPHAAAHVSVRSHRNRSSHDDRQQGDRAPQWRFVPPPGATTVSDPPRRVGTGARRRAAPAARRPRRSAARPVGHQQAELLGGVSPANASARSTVRCNAQTAHHCKRLGITPIEIHDLREAYFGDFEGGEYRRRAAANDPIMQRVFETQRWDAIPNAESTEAFGERISRSLDKIAAAHADQRIAVVVHGGVIGELMRRFAGSDQPFSFIGSDNGSSASRHQPRAHDDPALQRHRPPHRLRHRPAPDATCSQGSSASTPVRP